MKFSQGRNLTLTSTWHRIDSGCHKMSRDWQRGPSLLPNKLLPNGSGMSVVEIVVEIIKVESTHFNRGWNHSAIFVFSNITKQYKDLVSHWVVLRDGPESPWPWSPIYRLVFVRLHLSVADNKYYNNHYRHCVFFLNLCSPVENSIDKPIRTVRTEPDRRSTRVAGELRPVQEVVFDHRRRLLNLPLNHVTVDWMYFVRFNRIRSGTFNIRITPIVM